MNTENCKKRKKRDLTSSEWVQYQLECNLDPQFRDVVLHASFIEGVVINESEKYHKFPCVGEKGKFRSFGRALQLTKDEIGDIWAQMDKMRNLRNELIHEVAKKDGLNQNEIEEKIREIYQLILGLYHDEFVDKKFEELFGLSTKENKIVKKLANSSPEEISRYTSDS